MGDGTYDLAVIGAGPGGYVAAIRARQLGLSVAIIEKDRTGGRCLNYACIPAKAVLRSADVLDEIGKASRYGITLPGDGTPQVDWTKVARRRDRVVSTLTGGVAGLLKKHGIHAFKGDAALAAPGGDEAVELSVTDPQGEHELFASRVIIATGSVAMPVLGLKFEGRVLDTAGAWLTHDLPESLAVIGAGASGVEVASAFGRMGVRVTLIEALPRILPAEEPEIAEHVAKELGKQNVKVLAGAKIDAVEPGVGSVAVTVGGERDEFDRLCIAAGRAPDTESLDLAAAGVKTGERGLIEIDERQRTSNPRIYAIGDVVRGPALAHKASEEGVVAVEAMVQFEDCEPIVVDNIPRATFCAPQVSSIGLTEAQAREVCGAVTVGRFDLAAAGAATVYGDRTGFVKIIGDTESGEILGAHAVGPKAADLIAELAVAKSAQIGYPDLARIIHAHPTISEAVLEAARAADGWVLHA
ncbi:MAG: dihydrolipoyl dehydrogenase [Actinobacteria bacterium]|nr:dihydrolipoyl dehydrogenase [Actinomycetota bacterium]